MQKKIALVTGSSSGVGLEISKKLIQLDYFVFGISRTVSNDFDKETNYEHIFLDLRNSKELEKVFLELSKRIDSVDLLILNAGVGLIGLHEELKIRSLEDMINLNLLAPILITRILLRKIKQSKGIIIFISSVTAKKNSPLASAYSATKAGLSQFGNSLFEEVRKSGVKIINISPDIIKTSFYKDLSIEEFPNEDSYLDVQVISETIEFILKMPNAVFTEIQIEPNKKRIQRKTILNQTDFESK
jgi:short-subunit dehydrogenase